MPKGRELVGLPVINREGGEELGRVQDLIYDEKSGRLRALVLDGSRLRQPRVVDFDRLTSRGPKMFAVAGAAELGHEPPAQARHWQELKGMRLLNREGRELGLVEDLVVDLPSGRVQALEVSTGLVNDLLEGRREVPLDMIMDWYPDKVISSDDSLIS